MIRQRSLAIWIFLPLLLSACGLGGSGDIPPIDQTRTAIAFEVIVQSTLDETVRQTEAASGVSEVESESPEAVTATDTPTVTSVPETPTPSATFTPSIPLALILQNTNCRSGPGTVYDLLYIAMVGEQLTIELQSSLVDYVLVQIPGKPGSLCWLWTRYVEISGDIKTLQIRTPPPTPTPVIDFDVVFDYVDSCVGWDPGFKLTNIGDVTFKSYYVTLKDTVTSTTQDHTADIFDKTGGCPIVQSIPQLDPGLNGWAYAYSFIYDPAGNPMTGSIKLCTGTGLSGTCVTKPLSFTP